MISLLLEGPAPSTVAPATGAGGIVAEVNGAPDPAGLEPGGLGPGGPEPAGLRFSSAQGRWVIAAAVGGSAIAAIDATVVGIALPAIGRDFDVSLAPLQWVVTAYTLTLAGLLLVGGALGDRYGRRRVFLIGVAWFALASALCGLAPDAVTLIVARALQGVGAALLVPGSLAILQASFAPDDRGRAIGAWTALGGVATAAGPFLGGWLVEAVSWRMIFFINLPLALAVLVLAHRHVPESRTLDAAGRPETGRPDLLGGVLVTVGLVGVVYGLIDGPNAGWTSPPVLSAIVLGLTALAAFVGWERRVAEPTLPLGIFASRQFSAANVVTLIMYAALGGALFLLPLQLQQVAGYSPVRAGTALLPVTVMMLLLSARAGALASRIGPRLPMAVGPLVAGAGLWLLTRTGPSSPYLTTVAPGAVVLGLGLAICVAPLTATTLAAVAPEHAGAASAVNNDVARTGNLIAVALLPSLAGLTGDAYRDPGVFDDGFTVAMVICALTCVAGGLLAAGLIRNPPRPRPRARAADHPTCCPVDAPGLRAARPPGLAPTR